MKISMLGGTQCERTIVSTGFQFYMADQIINSMELARCCVSKMSDYMEPSNLQNLLNFELVRQLNERKDLSGHRVLIDL